MRTGPRSTFIIIIVWEGQWLIYLFAIYLYDVSIDNKRDIFVSKNGKRSNEEIGWWVLGSCTIFLHNILFSNI